nr:transposase, MuDR [Tanacetum cinerariifolium]
MVRCDKCDSIGVIRTSGNHPTAFTLKINHRGTLTSPPNVHYRGGKANGSDDVDADSFSAIEVQTMVKDFGYVNKVLQFYYKIPNSNLDLDPKPLSYDKDVMKMCNYVNKCKIRTLIRIDLVDKMLELVDQMLELVDQILVESETKNSWLWFFDCLGDDLELFRNSTSPSYQIGKRGEQYKDLLWRCATTTTVQKFGKNMEESRNSTRKCMNVLRKIHLIIGLGLAFLADPIVMFY